MTRAENRELTLAETINPKKPTKGLLLGTDFRHAVEFSRNGRATTPPSRAPSPATLSQPHHTAGRPTDLPGGHPQAVSRGAERKLRAPEGRVKPLAR